MSGASGTLRAWASVSGGNDSSSAAAATVPERRAMTAVEVLCWCALVVAIQVGYLAHIGGPSLFNDGYQYLSMAKNLQNHTGISTSIVHWETERAYGRIPAPVTTYPPGYPIAIWLVSSVTGMSLEHAGVAVSILSIALVTLVLGLIARAFVFPLAIGRVCLFLWVFNSVTAYFATSVLSEALFTAVAVSGVALVAVSERRGSRKKLYLFCGAALIGLSYWVRYAGLFLVVALLLHAAYRVLRRKNWAMWILSAAIGAGIAGSCMLRDILVSGHWKGTTIKKVYHPPLEVARDLAASGYNFAIENGPLRAGALPLLSALMIVAVAICVLWLLTRQRKSGGFGSQTPARSAFVLVCVLVYVAFMIYLGFFSMISFGTRMFFPILPLIIVLVGMIFSRAWAGGADRRPVLSIAVLALLMVCYAGGHLQVMRNPGPLLEHQVVAKALAAPTAQGTPLRLWIDANIPQHSTIMASDGQATAYLLGRNTVSLLGYGYTTHDWTEEQTRTIMQKFGARYMILYPNGVPEAQAIQSSFPFLRDLTAGQCPPWLQVVATNGNAEILRVQP